MLARYCAGPCLDTAETLPMDIDMVPIEIPDEQPTSPPFIESQWRLAEKDADKSPEAEKEPQVHENDIDKSNLFTQEE